MREKKFITTTLPYINSSPHIGHCFEFCLADVIATYYRHKLGPENVFLNVGVDEHGQKIQQKSIAEGFENPQIYCDNLAQTWQDFCQSFQIEYDNFYRTTDPKHKANVLRFYHEIADKLYQKQYQGQYCVGCESFKTDKEVVEGKCPIHQTPLLTIEEENIFSHCKSMRERSKIFW